MDYLLRPAGEGRLIPLTAGETVTVKAGDDDGGGRLCVFEIAVAGLAGPPEHVHGRHDEAFWVLEGQFRFRVAEASFTGGPGTFVLVPPGVPHTFSCIGAEPGRLMVMFTPGGTEAYFHELALRLGSLPAAAPDPADLADVLERHGVVIVGPPLFEHRAG